MIEVLFTEGALNLPYCEVERGVVGAAVATYGLNCSSWQSARSGLFCQRREVGVLNIGEAGSVTVDETKYATEHLGGLYIGRGSKEISFRSTDAEPSARFYLVSYPAHMKHPTTHAKKLDANALHLGTVEDANKPNIYQYIHENGIQSCQLVMGFTALESGSVWNTIPCNTHERRTEVYLYFGLEEDSKVFHMMEPSHETRYLVLSNEQAAISSMWSIHSGCGTKAYTFCWAMGGGNQRFDDMDRIEIQHLR